MRISSIATTIIIIMVVIYLFIYCEIIIINNIFINMILIELYPHLAKCQIEFDAGGEKFFNFMLRLVR